MLLATANFARLSQSELLWERKLMPKEDSIHVGVYMLMSEFRSEGVF